jgi:hypothetical protein
MVGETLNWMGEKFIDKAFEMSPFHGEKYAKERRLIKKIIDAAHKDIKYDRKNVDGTTEKGILFNKKGKQFVPEHYTTDTTLREVIAEYVRAEEPNNTTKIDEYINNIKGDGSYNILKAEIDYKRVWGTGKSYSDKLKATVGTMWRAAKIAAVPCAIIGGIALCMTAGPEAVEDVGKAFNNMSTGDKLVVAGALTGNRNLEAAGWYVDASQNLNNSNNMNVGLDIMMAQNAQNRAQYPTTSLSFTSSTNKDPNKMQERARDNTYRGNDHGVSIARAKIGEKIRNTKNNSINEEINLIEQTKEIKKDQVSQQKSNLYKKEKRNYLVLRINQAILLQLKMNLPSYQDINFSTLNLSARHPLHPASNRSG